MEKGCSINCINKTTQSHISFSFSSFFFSFLLCIFPTFQLLSSNQSINQKSSCFFLLCSITPSSIYPSIHPILNSLLCVFPSYSFFFLFRSYNYYTLLYNSNIILYIYISLFYSILIRLIIIIIVVIVQRKKKFLLSDDRISMDFEKDRLLYCYYLHHLRGHDDVVVDVAVLMVVEVILIESLRDSIYK